MKLVIKSIIMTSMLIASSAVLAQVKCSTPINIEIYDEGSRHVANVLKSKISSKTGTKIRVENIVNDENGYARRKLPYVHTQVTIFSRKNVDSSCLSATVRSLKTLGFESDEIAYRFYPVNVKANSLRVVIPPRTFFYE